MKMNLTKDDGMRNFVWKWCMTLILCYENPDKMERTTDGCSS